MKSWKWPINWRYEGDYVRAQDYHGEGRAVLGQLKNMTHGGANLGSNRLIKKYDDGVIITAEILPGIDKVTIYVPEYKGGEEEEEKKYYPYLWVGARIVSGGLWKGDTDVSEDGIPEDPSVDIWNQGDCFINLCVWEPPQESKQGQGATALDPNETQVISSWRDQSYGWQPWLNTTSDAYPLQECYYWLDDPTQGFGAQAYMVRAEMEVYGKYSEILGSHTYINDLTYQHTKDNLMNGGYLNPYDPEYSGDDDNIWERTIWCDPTISTYGWDKTPPTKTARGIIPGGVVGGGPQIYPNPTNNWDSIDDEIEMPGTIIPGLYVVKVCVWSALECPAYELPVVIEVEARVGKPWGRNTRSRVKVTINLDPQVANYINNIVPYGYYRETHLSTGEIDRFGDPVPPGYGACTHSEACWWQGAFLINANEGTIATVDNYDLGGDDREKYKWDSFNTVWPSSNTDYPFNSGSPQIHQCFYKPCTSTGCGDGSNKVTAYQTLINNGAKLIDGEGEPWVEVQLTATESVFVQRIDICKYAVGLRAQVRCTWDFTGGGIPEGYDPFDELGLFTSVLYSEIVICDDQYPLYNGENWLAIEYGLLEGDTEIWNGRDMQLGDYVYILVPQGNDAFKVVPEDYPLLLLLRKDGPADFFQKYPDPPPGYV